MERNKLADILEASLKKENLIEPQVPQPPPAPRSPPKQRVFHFSNDSSTQDSILNPIKSAETPKFSVENLQKPEKSGKMLKVDESPGSKVVPPPQGKPVGFFQPASKLATKVELPLEDKAPDILMEDEFEIDNMGEIWEYAGHSANVNNNEESESDSDEFDPNAVVRVVKKPNQVIEKNEEIQPESLKKDEKSAAKATKNKRVDLQTRKMMAEAKMQQNEMKSVVKVAEAKPVEEEIIVNVSNEWDNISVRELEEVKAEKPDFGYFNRNLSANDLLQFIETIPVELAPSPKKSFFRGFFSCFRVRSKSRSVLSSQKQKILKFSLTIFDNSDNLHVSLLKKVYTLIKNVENCGLEGDHWKEIGFQGKNPSTDLRKVGLFGPFCILYFFEKYQTHARKIFEFSVNPSTKFPFAAVALNFAEVALEDMESNVLLKEFEKEDRIYEVVLDFFCGLMIFWIRYFTENGAKVMEFVKSKEYVASYAAGHVSEILCFRKLKI